MLINVMISTPRSITMISFQTGCVKVGFLAIEEVHSHGDAVQITHSSGHKGFEKFIKYAQIIGTQIISL
jgi:hypothetical protein